jgi:hypothetical protein
MSFQLDLSIARKKLEIENQLIENINSDLLICLNDINWINTNCKLINNSEQINLINSKIFNCVNDLYNGFTFFYLKRKDFMGMNLTGLTGKKIETGLSFRNCMIKSNFDFIKKNFSELADVIKSELTNFNLNNLNYYKILTENFNFEFEKKFKYIIIVCDISEKIYWLYPID